MVDLHDSLRPSGTADPLPVSELATRVARRKRRRLATVGGSTVAAIGIAALVIINLPTARSQTSTVADGGPEVADSLDSPSGGDEAVVGDEAERVSETTRPTTATESPAAEPTSVPSDGGAAAGPDDPDSSSETPDSTVGSTGSTEVPEGATSSGPTVGSETTPGMTTSITTTSAWEDGYCIQVDVANDVGEGTAWQVVLDLDGAIDTIWNANAAESEPSGTYVFTGLADYNADLAPGSTTSFGTCVDT